MTPTGPRRETVGPATDDLREADNHLPIWWLAILFGSIVFGFGHWLVSRTTDTLKEPREVAAPGGKAFDAHRALAALAKAPQAVAEGRQVFLTTCAVCHGPEGAGLVGPNLTDRYWLHGATPTDLLRSVSEGFPDKGMPPWGRVLGDDKTRKVIAFVLSLKGKNLPGKGPQGDPVE